MEPTALSSNSRAGSLKLFPNPAVNQIGFSGESFPEGRIQVSIYDFYGRLIREQDLQNGRGVIIVGIADLPIGVYTISIASSEELLTSRFVKVVR